MKILLIRRGAIGGVLMTTPLLRQLKENFPDANIDYCVGNSASIVLKNNQHIDKLIILEDQVFSALGILKFIKFMLKIRKNYDYIFVLGKNWIVSLLCRLSGAKLIGFVRSSVSRFILSRYVKYDDPNRYQGLYYLDLLRVFGVNSINYDDLRLDLVVTQEDRKFVEEQLMRLHIQDDFIVLTNSGGNNQFETGGIRMLPETIVLDLINKIAGNHKLILLGSDADLVNYQNYITQSKYAENIVNLAGKLSIAQSCFLLSKAKHFYTTDCGAMHFGVVANITEKMTCFFGPTNPRHVLSLGSKCRVVWQDADTYDSRYQIFGKHQKRDMGYFQGIKIDEII